MVKTAPHVVDLKHAGRDSLEELLTVHCSDLRTRGVVLPDGRRARAARFTLLGQPFEVEAIEGEGITDADDELVRRCAWIVLRRLGLPARWGGELNSARTKAEQAIVTAAWRGDVARADQLGAELVHRNESRTVRHPLRIPWET